MLDRVVATKFNQKSMEILLTMPTFKKEKLKREMPHDK
jgi:hypothetical protein